MRTVSGPRNRTILVLLGLILLLGATALGLWASTWAPDTSATLGSLLGTLVNYPLLIAIVTTVIAVVFGLWWLFAQIPRKADTGPYRLVDDPDRGTVTVAPGVLARAVEDQLRAIPGITRALVQLAGTAGHPQVFITLTLDPATSLDRILEAVYTTVLPELQTALETPLQHVGLELDAERNPTDNANTSTRGTAAAPQRALT